MVARGWCCCLRHPTTTTTTTLVPPPTPTGGAADAAAAAVLVLLPRRFRRRRCRLRSRSRGAERRARRRGRARVCPGGGSGWSTPLRRRAAEMLLRRAAPAKRPPGARRARRPTTAAVARARTSAGPSRRLGRCASARPVSGGNRPSLEREAWAQETKSGVPPLPRCVLLLFGQGARRRRVRSVCCVCVCVGVALDVCARERRRACNKGARRDALRRRWSPSLGVVGGQPAVIRRRRRRSAAVCGCVASSYRVESEGLCEWLLERLAFTGTRKRARGIAKDNAPTSYCAAGGG